MEDRSTLLAVLLSQFIKENIGFSQDQFKILYDHPFLILDNIDQEEELDSAFHTMRGADEAQPVLKPPTHNLDTLIVPVQKVGDRHHFNMVTLGRSRNNDLVLGHKSISKAHAIFKSTFTGDGYQITDVGSMNGTKVNGRLLLKDTPKTLEPGDVLEFGDSYIAVFHTNQSLYLTIENYRGGFNG